VQTRPPPAIPLLQEAIPSYSSKRRSPAHGYLQLYSPPPRASSSPTYVVRAPAIIERLGRDNHPPRVRRALSLLVSLADLVENCRLVLLMLASAAAASAGIVFAPNVAVLFSLRARRRVLHDPGAYPRSGSDGGAATPGKRDRRLHERRYGRHIAGASGCQLPRRNGGIEGLRWRELRCAHALGRHAGALSSRAGTARTASYRALIASL
jgi:hypothetical protein